MHVRDERAGQADQDERPERRDPERRESGDLYVVEPGWTIHPGSRFAVV